MSECSRYACSRQVPKLLAAFCLTAARSRPAGLHQDTCAVQAACISAHAAR